MTMNLSDCGVSERIIDYLIETSWIRNPPDALKDNAMMIIRVEMEWK